MNPLNIQIYIYIYNFNFENLICKWKKKIENQQVSDHNFLGNVLLGVRVVFLSDCPLLLSLLKHRSVGAFFN